MNRCYTSSPQAHAVTIWSSTTIGRTFILEHCPLVSNRPTRATARGKCKRVPDRRAGPRTKSLVRRVHGLSSITPVTCDETKEQVLDP